MDGEMYVNIHTEKNKAGEIAASGEIGREVSFRIVFRHGSPPARKAAGFF